MMGTALVLYALGATALFLPAVVLQNAANTNASVPIQLFGGALLAFASLNWMGRGAVYGGIYGRPIVIANFGLGMISGATAFSATRAGRLPPWGWGLVLVFTLQAIGFYWLLRRPPWDTSTSASAASSGESA